MVYPIDFVMPWVDGNDPDWLSEKRKYQDITDDASTLADANGECRYRENGLLKYWFRGVEAFTPWVNRIYFITCGHKPEWLNTDHPKITWIKHEDYIPKEFLPTFNAGTIEMNLHRIQELSEHFVLFNDDMFFLRPVAEDMFFRNGDPVLDARLVYQKNRTHNWEWLLYNNSQLLNRSFNPIKSIWTNRNKWFDISELGITRVAGNIYHFLQHRSFPTNTYGHVALPHLKSSLAEIWERYPEYMAQSSSHRFRSDDGVNQWLLCGWNQAKGRFYPAHFNRLGILLIYSDENAQWISSIIEGQSLPQACLNETEDSIVSDGLSERISRAFDTILPNKSSFEL